VFPNPAQAGAHLNLGQLNGASAMVRMFDLNGRQVLEERIPAGMDILQLPASLASGMYNLALERNGDAVHNTRLIVTQ
jgi:hypothetical protein